LKELERLTTKITKGHEARRDWTWAPGGAGRAGGRPTCEWEPQGHRSQPWLSFTGRPPSSRPPSAAPGLVDTTTWLGALLRDLRVLRG